MLLPINNIHEKSHAIPKKDNSLQITVLPFSTLHYLEIALLLGNQIREIFSCLLLTLLWIQIRRLSIDLKTF